MNNTQATSPFLPWLQQPLEKSTGVLACEDKTCEMDKDKGCPAEMAHD